MGLPMVRQVCNEGTGGDGDLDFLLATVVRAPTLTTHHHLAGSDGGLLAGGESEGEFAADFGVSRRSGGRWGRRARSLALVKGFRRTEGGQGAWRW